MIDHCIAAYRQRTEDKSYRIYITDALKAISENTTYKVGIAGVAEVGSKMNARWHEVMNPKEEKPKKEVKVDNRTCEEVVDDIWERSGIWKG